MRPVWKSQAGGRGNCKLLDKWWEGLAQRGLVILIRSRYRSARNGMSRECMRALRVCAGGRELESAYSVYADW